ncbi:glycosyltransferase [Candidatus Woesearchaeota archaeon]|nr:MAG: glycosyltransferase [Candidatus Woesearchaeota archaeon]
MRGVLIIFAKNPDTESVKTRLGRDIGKKRAKKIYTKILNKLIRTNRNQDYRLVVYSYGDPEYFLKYGIKVKQQKGLDLGERMLNAFREELKISSKAVLIGSDIPTIGRKKVSEAFRILEDCDVVLGPALDGGYYLVGMKKPLNIFSLDMWSHSNVLADTIKLIEENKYSYALLEEMRDIDTAQDLEYYTKIGIL